MPPTDRVRRKVFVTRAIDSTALERLRAATAVTVWRGEMPPPAPALRSALASADAVLSMITDKLDAGVIAGAPRLRVISNLGVGVDNIDLEAATRAGIAVGHTPGVLTDATADLAFGLLMATGRRIAEADRQVRAGMWRTWAPMTMLGHDVHSSTIGLIGFGAIGRAMAQRAMGFGMRVLYLKHSSSQRVAGAVAVGLPRLLAESDYVSIHVPLTVKTRHMIGAREFALMKPGAILVNTARGAVVDQAAMLAALKSGRLGGAGLDVTDPEPIARHDPLLRLDNVVITPHIGSASIATRARMAAIAVENILEVFAGRVPRLCANPQVRLRHPNEIA
ncbi:MAG TPA: D-glycerate dehydrogenase [Candidatus Binatus sp.]|uniref:2-hydroxyacid dehydrogenase n=1 Tax=Candidatus Binatus sp. TaxID=2811406 RepID=UPI002F3E66C6